MSIATRALIALCVTILAAGCAGRRGTDDAAGSTVPSGSEATTTGMGDGSAAAGSTLESAGSVGGGSGMAGPTEGLLGRRVVYFDYDRDEVRADDRALVAAHVQYLASNPSVRIRLEGHTDERGTREYNVGLAERRAQAVRRALTLEGSRDEQAQTVSFGEERPAASGEDETAYAQNRRVEIVYGL
jgi:peptidoglycan-associated lipoprotein